MTFLALFLFGCDSARTYTALVRSDGPPCGESPTTTCGLGTCVDPETRTCRTDDIDECWREPARVVAPDPCGACYRAVPPCGDGYCEPGDLCLPDGMCQRLSYVCDGEFVTLEFPRDPDFCREDCPILDY